MTAQIISGTEVAKEIRAELKEEIAELKVCRSEGEDIPEPGSLFGKI